MEFKLGNVVSLKSGEDADKEKQQPRMDPRTVSEENLFEYYGQREEFTSWKAKPKITKTNLSKRAIRSLSIIGVVVGILLALMGEFVLLVLIISIIFFTNVLNKLEPEEVSYVVSNYGIRINDVDYYWFSLTRFFMYEKEEEKIIAYDTTLPFPRRIFLSLTDQVDINSLVEFCAQRIPLLKEPPSDAFDNAYKKILDKFDL